MGIGMEDAAKLLAELHTNLFSFIFFLRFSL